LKLASLVAAWTIMLLSGVFVGNDCCFIFPENRSSLFVVYHMCYGG
jgi:hypothetical protein